MVSSSTSARSYASSFAAQAQSERTSSGGTGAKTVRVAPIHICKRRRRAGCIRRYAICVAAWWTPAGASEASTAAVGRSSASAIWPRGQVEVGAIDAALESVAAAVFDDIERKTFVNFVRVEQGGLAIRTVRPTRTATGGSGAGPSTQERVELCCFGPKGGPRTQRRLAVAMVQALGVSLSSERNTTAKITLASAGATGGSGDNSAKASPRLIDAAEADAINRAYAAEVLPTMGQLPAVLDVGAYQLATNYEAVEWSKIVSGRGRRLMSGAMRFAVGLHSSGQMASLVGALPTFVFHKNKAQVLLLGAESAELMPGSFMPPEVPDEGLGAGIQRVTQYARSLPGRSIEGGVPTFLGDGSAVLLRSAFARTATMQTSESLESILQEHHSAAKFSEVSRWAQSQGAALGFPSFAAQVQKTPQTGATQDVALVPMEVILVMARSAGSPTQQLQTQGRGSIMLPAMLLVLGASMGLLATASTSGVPSTRAMLTAAGALRATLGAMRRLRHRLGGMTAELDLEDIVNSL